MRGRVTMRGWLDGSLDGVTRRTLPTLPLRLVIGVSAALMTGSAVGWRVALVWAAANTAAELWTWFATAAQRQGRPQTVRRRAVYLASLVWMNSVWAALAALLWTTGEAGLQLCAAFLLACQMLHASLFNSGSNALLAVVFGIPATTLVALTVIAGASLGDNAAYATATAVLMVGYIFWSALVNRRNARALEASREAAVAANEAKSAFLALVSHELRTPMTGVLGMADALGRQPLPEAARGQVTLLQRAGEGLLRLVNDLLDLSKAEAGKLEVALESVDLDQLLLETVAFWRGAAARKGLGLSLEPTAGGAAWVEADPVRLRQILNNLLSNAIKFTERGGVAVGARAAEGGQGWVEVNVIDQGPGLAPDQLERVFQPYVQAPAEAGGAHGGTGLGLPIARGLARAMGGELTLVSGPGAGSIFTLRLRAASAQARQAAPEGAEAASLVGVRVIAADDNATNRAVLETMLGALGAEIRVESGGRALLDAIAGQAFAWDLVLLDVRMPDLDGPAVLRRLKGERLVPASVPVLAFTADAAEEQIAALRAAGFDGVITKPVQAAGLAQALQAALRRRAVAGAAA